jgi:ATPase subunit of ABC transporter with duplicated ATPase domains
MSTLEAVDLTIEAGGRIVVEGLSLTLRPGDKVGVVGRNGAGKTSTLEVLAGEAAPLAGRVVRRGEVGYLRQDPRQHRAADRVTGLEHVLEARDLVELERAVEKARLALEEHTTERLVARFARLEEQYRSAGGYRAEAEARAIAAGLGLPQDRLLLPVTALSGGERRRLELTRILFAGSDLLLLDEPTNHLDVDARTWLLRFLAGHRGALLVVSHDLVLLDASITHVLHLDDDGIHGYRGTYSAYREARRLDEARRARLAARQGAEIARLRTLADAMRGQTAKRARTAKALDSRVARLERGRIEGPSHERSVAFRFPPPPRAGRTVLAVDGLAKGYGGPPVFRDVAFDLGRGERLIVMGLNGAGKSSLLRILAGAVEPDAGSVRVGHVVSIGYYAQEHEGIEPGISVLDHMRSSSRADDQTLRGLLGMFVLRGDVAFQDAGTLSGGEKTKLALAQLVAGRRNLLLLDEPTNDLDPPSRAAIAEALRDWPGAMILVSHDPGFVQALTPERVLLMPDGELDHWRDEHLELVELA